MSHIIFGGIDQWKKAQLNLLLKEFLSDVFLSRFQNSGSLRTFSSEPGVANEILENEPKSCLAVA